MFINPFLSNASSDLQKIYDKNRTYHDLSEWILVSIFRKIRDIEDKSKFKKGCHKMANLQSRIAY